MLIPDIAGLSRIRWRRWAQTQRLGTDHFALHFIAGSISPKAATEVKLGAL